MAADPFGTTDREHLRNEFAAGKAAVEELIEARRLDREDAKPRCGGYREKEFDLGLTT